MEKFVVRGAEALRHVEQQSGHGRQGKQRMRQTRIIEGSKVVVEEQVQLLREELDEARTEANMMRVLEALEGQFISLEMLEKTAIGVSLSRLQRRAQSDQVKERANKLLRLWKVRAKKAMKRRYRRVQTFGRNAAE